MVRRPGRVAPRASTSLRRDRGLLLAVGAIAAAGLAIRIWYILAVAKKSPLVGDALGFNGLARVLSEGHGFVSPFIPPGHAAMPTAHKPPLYPLVLALVSIFGGRSYVAHQIATAAVGAATVLVIAVLTRRVAGWRAGVLAAVLGAGYPAFVANDASLRSESLYVLLVALALLAAYRVLERPSRWRLLQLGVTIGLAALTRSEGLVLLVLLAAPAVWRSGEQQRGRRVALVCAACAVVLAPWLIRCWVVFDQPVAISTNYGDLIAGANCAATYSGPLQGEWSFPCVLGEHGRNEATIAKRLRSRGLRYASDHADRLPGVLLARALRPWGLFRPDGEVRLHAIGEGRNQTASWLGLAAAWGLMVLAPLGLLVLRRRRKPLFVLVAPLVLVLLVTVSGYGSLRFRAPADIALIVLGAVAVDALWPRRRVPAMAGPQARPSTGVIEADRAGGGSNFG